MNASITDLWEKLKTIRSATLRYGKKDIWQGFSTVLVTCKEDQTIIFHEKGEWKNRNLSFTNTLRWTLNSDGILLEHLRFGFQSPVSLVHLASTSHNHLNSNTPHLCGQDRYSAEVSWNQEEIHLLWSVQGPLKNEKIYSHYR